MTKIDYKHHKYTLTDIYYWPRHCWSFIGPSGALHLTASVSSKYPVACGLEYHHTTGSGAPDHIDCPLTGGRCWHEGTSLYATEHIWPLVEPLLKLNDHKTIFQFLENEYEKHFERSSP